MAVDQEIELYAVVDKIRFASRENPITEINLRTLRGGLLEKHSQNNVDGIENLDLPAILGGTNASGKTSLLRGIREICKLLQYPIITHDLSMNCRKELTKMGIRHLELEFITELGTSKSSKWFPLGLGGMPRYGDGDDGDIVSIKADLTGEKGHFNLKRDASIDNNPLVLENVHCVKFEQNNDVTGMEWRDGLRLRRVGFSYLIEEMYPRYGNLEEDKKKPVGFRKIKNKKSIQTFLDGCKERSFEGLELTNYQMDGFPGTISDYVIRFQNSTLVEVDREGTGQTIERLRHLVPQLTSQFKKWKDEPSILRDKLTEMMENNQLFTALGLKTADVLYDDPNTGYYFLHDYAPDIVESLMLKGEYVNFYTWHGDFAWKHKDDGIRVVMEGCLHDIVSYVTGSSTIPRMLIGDKNEGVDYFINNSPSYEVKWVDFDKTQSEKYYYGKKYVWPDKQDLVLRKSIQAPVLSEILRELPFLAKLMGMNDEDANLLDILLRFNAFTPIENVDQPYLSSGQRQVLALISAVKSADEGSLILLDEPEISLHIDWQERLVEQLHAPLTGSRLIIATHSPDIVARHRHLCKIIESNDSEGFYRNG